MAGSTASRCVQRPPESGSGNMVILDTDHMSLLEWEDNPAAKRLEERLNQLPPHEIATIIINFEEQVQGWMTVLAKARKVAEQIEAYRRLNRLLRIHGGLHVLDFDENPAVEFQRPRKESATMDVKIAAIVVSQKAIWLTRNLQDFSQVPGLQAEDWTKEAGAP